MYLRYHLALVRGHRTHSCTEPLREWSSRWIGRVVRGREGALMSRDLLSRCRGHLGSRRGGWRHARTKTRRVASCVHVIAFKATKVRRNSELVVS